MDSLNIAIVLIGMIILFIGAEISSFIFNINADKFYKIFHFVGGAMSYLLFLNMFYNRFFAIVLVLVLGLFWELHEWLLWKFFLKKKKFKPGGRDTLNDLMMDVLGALVIYAIEILHIV